LDAAVNTGPDGSINVDKYPTVDPNLLFDLDRLVRRFSDKVSISYCLNLSSNIWPID